MQWLRFDWALLAVDLFKISIAFLLALPVAWERERSTRIMGLRTFPLVAVARPP
jgi:putative Mg2+ transporter-C (MgtC) family protein